MFDVGAWKRRADRCWFGVNNQQRIIADTGLADPHTRILVTPYELIDTGNRATKKKDARVHKHDNQQRAPTWRRRTAGWLGGLDIEPERRRSHQHSVVTDKEGDALICDGVYVF